MPRCFVISPIGSPGSDVREHADAVFECIIEPALADAGIEAVRADKIATPGQITVQMISAIVGYDFCIADLTGHNPNVFYELALAQAAERPVIILAEAGERIPFDLQDFRVMEYDLQPRNVKSGKWVTALKEAVGAIRDPGYRPPRLLPERSVLAAPDPLAVRFFECAEQYGTRETWMTLLHETTHHFDISGIALGSWRAGRGFGSEIVQKAAAGCAVRILILDPENPVLGQLLNARVPEEQPSVVVAEVSAMAEYFRGVVSRAGSQAAPVEFRTVKIGCPHFQICRTDQAATLLQYLYSDSAHYSPLWHAPAGSALYQVAAHEFEALWQANAPPPSATGIHAGRGPARSDSWEPALRWGSPH